MHRLSRRRMLTLTSAGALGATFHAKRAHAGVRGFASTPQWEVFEIALKGPRDGNPFRDVQLTAVFSQGNRHVEVEGFYDGDGQYKVRFMPDTVGEWNFTVSSRTHGLDGKSGQFSCTPAKQNAHGPVAVQNTHHFAYADGTPFRPFGTTCYAWIHQSEELQHATLASLAKSPFNKLRMCVFPKHYEYNHNEPALYPFERDATGKSDFTRPNPAFYRHLEARISDLLALGIEVDLILFHPYDRWGYATMSADNDDHYVRYVMARLSACRNIWWSLANEYDFMKEKAVQDFDRLLQIVARYDPVSHLRSIHHGKAMYNYAHPWVTHASLQTGDFGKTAEYLAAWRKPVVYDEVQYEGNLNRRWGNLSGEEMTYRFWRGVIGGAYVTHGETLLFSNDSFNEDATPTIWWSHGGTLNGTGPARIAFLRKILNETLAGGGSIRNGLKSSSDQYYPYASAFLADETTVASILYFLDYHQPIWYEFPLPDGNFTAEVIDPWKMTVTPIPGKFAGKTKLRLPGKPYQALRFCRVS